MPCAVINVLHPMIGVDIHGELSPTVPPVPVPYVPHAVAAPLGNVPGALMGTVKRTDTSQGKKAVLVNFVKMPIIIQGSDIGPIIPHIPMVPCNPIPNLPLIILGSGSASEFFAFSVKAHGKAIANAPAVFLAMNMNCGFPPTPGIVIAPSLVFTGFRMGDFIAGMVGLLMDAALSAAISIAFNGLPLGNKEGAKVLFGGGIFGLIKGPLGGAVIKSLVTGGISLVVGSVGGLGSPLGYSNENTTLLGGGFKERGDDVEHGRVGDGWGSFKENTQNAVAGYFTAP